MISKELITHAVDDPNEQNQLVRNAVNYALLSIPFTFDRLANRNLTKNILNIAKGKFAENYFYHFCKLNQITLDTSTLSTPFYQADKKDFLYNGIEWDIKNNYLQHNDQLLPEEKYLDQFGLIPNRGPWDQWSKREKLNMPDSLGCGYIFTFMKKGDLDSQSDFLKIQMNLDQKNFLLDLYEKYQGKHQNESPYESADFWNKFHDLGPNYDFELSHFPTLVITGVAQAIDFPKFSQIKPSDMKSQYLRTIIENMGVVIRDLTSFKHFAGL